MWGAKIDAFREAAKADKKESRTKDSTGQNKRRGKDLKEFDQSQMASMPQLARRWLDRQMRGGKKKKKENNKKENNK